jgi:hypothetical protein
VALIAFVETRQIVRRLRHLICVNFKYLLYFLVNMVGIDQVQSLDVIKHRRLCEWISHLFFLCIKRGLLY